MATRPYKHYNQQSFASQREYERMNIFIVYAHPEPKSFDGQMRDFAIDLLTRIGHAVQVSDLYDMEFEPEVTIDDFSDPLEPKLFDLHTEQEHAARTGTFSPDILAEQQKLLWCNLLILQFPLWWYSTPAIMKGWIDRVLTYGFAYGTEHNLSGRRAMLVMTTGGPPRPYTHEKREAISKLLDHLQHGTLHFCGMDVLPPFAVYGANNASTEQRREFMEQYGEILLTLDTLAPIRFRNG